MDFSTLLDVAKVLGVVVVLAGLFYSYYKSQGVRTLVQTVLPFVPALLASRAAATEDKEGVFDAHDMWVVLERVTRRINGVVDDPANKNFEDVQDDVFDIVSTELNRYREAGVTGVPDINDEAVRVQVRVVFEAVQRALGEDSTGDNN